MLKPLVHNTKLLLILILDLIFRLKKYLMYIYNGKHEFERICEQSFDIYEKTMRMDQWLMRTNCGKIRDYWEVNIYHKTATASCPAHQIVDRILRHYKVQPTHKPRGKSRSNNAGDTLLVNLEDCDGQFCEVLSDTTEEFLKLIRLSKQTKLTAKNERVLRDIIYRVSSYQFSLMIMLRMAASPYNSSNGSHTVKLMSMWNNLARSDAKRLAESNNTIGRVFPDDIRAEVKDDKSIVSSRWSHIGFQGEDPGTDFRGMGLLGLEQLEYLSRRSNYLPLDLLQRSLNQAHEYPFAIVGINITYNLVNLFKDGSLKHLYFDCGDVLFRNKRRSLNLIKTFNDLYVELFLRFDCFWHESKPTNIFAFRELMEKFISVIKMDLCNRTFSFKFIY